MTRDPAAAPALTRIRFDNPNLPNLASHIRRAATLGLAMVARDGFAGAKGIVICGSAPSLTSAHSLRKIRALARRGWHVMACKEAIRLLIERNVAVDFSVSMDPGENQWRKTHLDARITYCVASSCHPALFDYTIRIGDVFTVYPGCDKSASACKAKFDNIINHRGFPLIPGSNKALQTPDAPY
jgi:Phage conserved hypothetical protein BR0599/6-hydroxymethylpterin diphosphokinase MptE-like